MTSHGQHTITVHTNRWRAYAVCTCLNQVTGKLWRSQDAVSEPVARRVGKRHLEAVLS